MALIVEDGTIVAGAESYASVAEADARLAALGFTTWQPLLTAEKEAALRRSFVFMNQTFRSLWKGTKVEGDQPADFPRDDMDVEDVILENDIVPLDVKNAQIDLSIKAAAGDLNPDTTGQKLLRKKLGPLEKEFSNSGTAVAVNRALWMSLAPYLNLSGSNRVIR